MCDDEDVLIAFENIAVNMKREIFVTKNMKNLYKEVFACTNVYICIEGASSIGKTTTLYWLYHQLNGNPQFFVIAIPFQSISEPNFVKDMRSQAKSCRKDQKLIVLIYILSAAVFPNVTRLLFQLLVSIELYKVVFAESSSFHLYTCLQARSAKNWHTCLSESKRITFKPFEKGRV